MRTASYSLYLVRGTESLWPPDAAATVYCPCALVARHLLTTLVLLTLATRSDAQQRAVLPFPDAPPKVDATPRPFLDSALEASAGSGFPDISDPGPDTADLPDSAYTVAPGVVFFETSLTYESSKGARVRNYFTATLIRVGIREDLEFRMSTPGVIHETGALESTTGFGPLTFGFKRHIWDEVEPGQIPAFGIIAQVSAPTASAGFDNGAAEPTVFFNFDHSLPADFDFEWNVGTAWLKADDGERFFQGSYLWSLGRGWTEDFRTFFHGFVLVPGGSGDEEELVLGPGAFWAVTRRVGVDASYNYGLTGESPHRLLRGGLSVAF